MAISQQLRGALHAHLGPHATAELEKALSSGPSVTPDDIAALERELAATRADLEKAVLRIEHLERDAVKLPEIQ